MLTNTKLHLNLLSIPGESLAARYKWCLGPAVEKHCARLRKDTVQHMTTLIYFRRWRTQETGGVLNAILLFVWLRITNAKTNTTPVNNPLCGGVENTQDTCGQTPYINVGNKNSGH